MCLLAIVVLTATLLKFIKLLFMVFWIISSILNLKVSLYLMFKFLIKT